MSGRAQKKKSRYTVEQRQQAVELARDAENVSQVARDLGIAVTTLYDWLRAAREEEAAAEAGEQSPAELRAELRRVKAELRRAQMERDFLKKAAAFFAREDDSASSS